MRKALMLTPLALVSAAPAVEQPSPPRMKATVSALVGFGTRHSLSDPNDPKRGIGAARAWAKAQFDAIGAACGGCLTSETIARDFTGPRAPDGVNVVDVLGVQKGTDPDRVELRFRPAASRADAALGIVGIGQRVSCAEPDQRADGGFHPRWGGLLDRGSCGNERERGEHQDVAHAAT